MNDRRIEQDLEGYLSGSLDPRAKAEFEAVLGDSERHMIQQFENHARVIRTLRAPAEAEPSPGFYARVLDRIEAQRPVSIWASLLDPVFFRRLAYASLALVALTVMTLATSAPVETLQATHPHPSPEAVMAVEPQVTVTLTGTSSSDARDAVLVDLATYSE